MKTSQNNISDRDYINKCMICNRSNACIKEVCIIKSYTYYMIMDLHCIRILRKLITKTFLLK